MYPYVIKAVTIVDPHLKRDDDYYVYKEAKNRDLLIKKSDNTVFYGWCLAREFFLGRLHEP